MTQFVTEDLEAALRRAFIDKHAKCIVITSLHERFQIESAKYGVDRGWLRGEMDTSDEQSSVWICRLTEEGRRHFGLTKDQ